MELNAEVNPHFNVLLILSIARSDVQWCKYENKIIRSFCLHFLLNSPPPPTSSGHFLPPVWGRVGRLQIKTPAGKEFLQGNLR